MVKYIDYDRGVRKRVHPSGLEIYMYVDEPGIFRNAFGGEVAVSLAAEAGFDTERLRKERYKQTRLKDALAQIEKEDADSPVEKQVKEREGYTLVNIGMGRYHVRDPEGNLLTPNPVSREVGERLFEALVPAEPLPEDKSDEKETVVVSDKPISLPSSKKTS